jgi:hypothetical protein
MSPTGIFYLEDDHSTLLTPGERETRRFWIGRRAVSRLQLLWRHIGLNRVYLTIS